MRLLVGMYGLVSLTCCTLGGTFNGSMYSCTSFGMKVGGGIGSALSGWLLAAAKFHASALTQSAGCSNMLTFLFAGIPVLITALIVFIYFKLDVEKANTRLRAEKDHPLN